MSSVDIEYSDGGFPHIKLCAPVIVEQDKSTREYSSSKVMSIQQILNYRKETTPFLQTPIKSISNEQKRTTSLVFNDNELKQINIGDINDMNFKPKSSTNKKKNKKNKKNK